MTSFPSSSMISILLFSVILCFLRRWAGIVICPLLVTLPAVILFHCITCLLVLHKGVVLFKDLLWGLLVDALGSVKPSYWRDSGP